MHVESTTKRDEFSGGRELRLGTSPGLRRVLASILVGILVGNVTRGSGSPAKADR